jgi:hypothetical protein
VNLCSVKMQNLGFVSLIDSSNYIIKQFVLFFRQSKNIWAGEEL